MESILVSFSFYGLRPAGVHQSQHLDGTKGTGGTRDAWPEGFSKVPSRALQRLPRGESVVGRKGQGLGGRGHRLASWDRPRKCKERQGARSLPMGHSLPSRQVRGHVCESGPPAPQPCPPPTCSDRVCQATSGERSVALGPGAPRNVAPIGEEDGSGLGAPL